MHIVVVGQGYVGSTLTAWFGAAGHDVTGVEPEERRLRALRRGRAPVFEPGVDNLLGELWRVGRVSFVERYADLPRPGDVVVVAVNTPSFPWGQADLSQVRTAMAEILRGELPRALILRSTVPPGTSRTLTRADPELEPILCCVPDFFNQGTALADLDRPSRVVIGAFHPRPVPLVEGLLASRTGATVPTVVTDPTSAELIKYASNAALAAKMSFANELAAVCDAVGADIDEVVDGVGSDPRIGRSFLRPGIGFGDSCLPKDTRAFRYWLDSAGCRADMVDATIRVNERQRARLLQMVAALPRNGVAGRFGKIAVLGVRNEPASDDIREAACRWAIPQLADLADSMSIWDPGTGHDQLRAIAPAAVPAASVTEALSRASVAVVLTQWPELLGYDWAVARPTMTPPAAVVDPTNFLSPDAIGRAGLVYRGNGRGRALAAPDRDRATADDVAERDP